MTPERIQEQFDLDLFWFEQKFGPRNFNCTRWLMRWHDFLHWHQHRLRTQGCSVRQWLRAMRSCDRYSEFRNDHIDFLSWVDREVF